MASFTPNLRRTSVEFNKLKKTTTPFNPNLWTTQKQQQIYTSKLIKALRRRSPPSSTSVAAKQVRETADRVLAVAAKGTMRWSRSILSAGAKVTKKHKRAKVVAGRRRWRRSEINKEKRELTVVERKLRVLGRLVPGCRKLAYSNLLAETSDYIAALEMQVRAMTDITEFLGGGGGAQPPAPADRLGGIVDL
ncbi:hypothetical protein HRI_001608800 [Hibiscus trionum]|uniref:BHLH domain-containing protein n=1 Tax=Hibiscus trionum TaxID=183268 RepID=A0A9W7HKE6_HIBTR|nr:hypothetical protein HRI_001608800 [Hibiscus trionum]